MKLNTKEVLKPALTLLIICVVVTALLAGTNLLTRNQIEQQNIATEEASQKVVLPNAKTFEQSADKSYTIGKNEDETAGYVFVTESKGYGGTVKVMTGIQKDGKIGGVVILFQSETPGLGANAQKESFRDQYKQVVPKNGFSVIKSGTKSDGQIEAMTGATITSTAVTNAVNKAIALYHTIKGGA